MLLSARTIHSACWMWDAAPAHFSIICGSINGRLKELNPVPMQETERLNCITFLYILPKSFLILRCIILMLLLYGMCLNMCICCTNTLNGLRNCCCQTERFL